jgi:hypothetical protein
MTQITPIPQWMFTVVEPEGYDPDANFIAMQVVWDRLPQKCGDLGTRLQVYTIAHFMGIKVITKQKATLVHLQDSGILETTGLKNYDLTQDAKCFLYHKITTDENFVPAAVQDLEFYKENLSATALWIDAQMRHHNGEYTTLEKAGRALKALPAAAAQFVKDRVQWHGLPLLEKQAGSGNYQISFTPPTVSMPQVAVNADGKKTFAWPKLNDGSNLLEAPAPKEEAEDPAPAAKPEVQEETPAPEKPKARKTTKGKGGPKRGPDGKFLPKEKQGSSTCYDSEKGYMPK